MTNLLQEKKKLQAKMEPEDQKRQRQEMERLRSFNWEEVKYWSDEKIFAEGSKLVLRFNNFEGSGSDVSLKLGNVIKGIKEKNPTLKTMDPLKLIWKCNDPYPQDKGGLFKIAFRNP